MKFLTDLDTRKLKAKHYWLWFKRRQFQLTAPLALQLRPEIDLPNVYAEQGYVTDFATTPLLLLGFLDADSERPAVIHDKVCSDGYLYVWDEGPTEQRISISRAKGDEIFLEAMEAEGVGWVRRYPMYAAVRTRTLIGG